MTLTIVSLAACIGVPVELGTLAARWMICRTTGNLTMVICTHPICLSFPSRTSRLKNFAPMSFPGSAQRELQHLQDEAAYLWDTPHATLTSSDYQNTSDVDYFKLCRINGVQDGGSFFSVRHIGHGVQDGGSFFLSDALDMPNAHAFNVIPMPTLLNRCGEQSPQCRPTRLSSWNPCQLRKP